jgi:hypothetical protein
MEPFLVHGSLHIRSREDVFDGIQVSAPALATDRAARWECPHLVFGRILREDIEAAGPYVCIDGTPHLNALFQEFDVNDFTHHLEMISSMPQVSPGLVALTRP